MYVNKLPVRLLSWLKKKVAMFVEISPNDGCGAKNIENVAGIEMIRML